MRMRNRRASVIALVLVLPILFFVVGIVGAQPPNNIYYETLFVGNGPGLFANEVAVVSAWSTWNPMLGEAPQQGIFADFNTAATPANAIHAAALDSSANGAIPNVFAPTGALAVAKNIGGVNGIETYYISPAGGEVNPTHQVHLGTQELVSPVPVSFLTPTASMNPVQAMDIANGLIPAGMMPFTTEYIITAEQIGNNIWLGVYAMTNQMGIPVMPFFVNATNTGTAGPCQGLTTSNGKSGWFPQSRNDIVFVDGNNIVHAQWFEISAAAFPFPLDQNTRFPGVPWQLPPQGTIGGVWICQTATPIPNTHNVGISFLPPGGGRGWLFILHDQAAPHPITGGFQTTVPGFGGGPICHIPTGLAWLQRSPSYWALVGWPPSGAVFTGWFVANPPAGGVPWTLEAVDANGMRPGLYIFQYTPGWVPNGTPLSDPTMIGFNPIPIMGYQTGLVWIPETDGLGNFQIHYASGVIQPPPVFPPWIVLSTFPHSVAAANHPPLPPLPLGGTPWPATSILQDQKTNSKADYGLFILGY